MIRIPSAFARRPAADCSFAADVLAGLRSVPKSLPCKYFYDQRGSQLFDAICQLDEYYLTRAELAIMNRYGPAMARAIGLAATLIEYGSGSSIKTRILLDHLERPRGYVPVDISGEHLRTTVRRLASSYPHIPSRPVCADFSTDFALPDDLPGSGRRVIYFPGSTLGNFESAEATALLARIVETCGSDGGLLIGIDLRKDVRILEAAYNDAAGVTAQFNLNLLARINRQLGADFDLGQFRHHAQYDSYHHRIEMRLISCRDQAVHLGQYAIPFSAGEFIRTEYSHKYSIDAFRQMAAGVGLTLQNCWTDDHRFFAVLYCDLQTVATRPTAGGPHWRHRSLSNPNLKPR